MKTIKTDEVARAHLRTLKDCMTRKGITLRTLSYKLHIPDSTLFNYTEKDRDNCRIEIYNKLAKYFDWPEYVPNRKLLEAPASPQQQIEFTAPAPTPSKEYRLKECLIALDSGIAQLRLIIEEAKHA